MAPEPPGRGLRLPPKSKVVLRRSTPTRSRATIPVAARRVRPAGGARCPGVSPAGHRRHARAAQCKARDGTELDRHGPGGAYGGSVNAAAGSATVWPHHRDLSRQDHRSGPGRGARRASSQPQRSGSQQADAAREMDQGEGRVRTYPGWQDSPIEAISELGGTGRRAGRALQWRERGRRRNCARSLTARGSGAGLWRCAEGDAERQRDMAPALPRATCSAGVWRRRVRVATIGGGAQAARPRRPA